MARHHFQCVTRLFAVFLLLPYVAEAGAMETDSAEAVVQAQVEAYNAHDIHAFAATYAKDAEIYEFAARLMMKGVAQIEEHYGGKLFNDPRLHATIAKRIAMGDVVVDHEKVALTLPEGAGRIEAIAIYEVRAGKITKVTLLRGSKVIDPVQK